MTAPTLPDLADFPGVTVAESDGVPVLLAPREGNVGAGIIFRVGSADETLATSGITHLTEHLALRTQVLSEAHLNGQTRSDVTLFHVAGTAADVVAYLNDVCASLRDLPLDLVETEKEILRSEADLRNPGAACGCGSTGTAPAATGWPGTASAGSTGSPPTRCGTGPRRGSRERTRSPGSLPTPSRTAWT
ncbi:hypothetical protein AB1046_06415 [Promicromonospora sp. Populi]|uniref:hypothetical protein n=1 Tax=Promicromonospora sp. Populi TaxID=3239420 RepID=UPI0034E25C47